jgi:hypothetical protein
MDVWEAESLESVMPGRTHPLALRCVRSFQASEVDPDSEEDIAWLPQNRTLIVKALGHPEVTRTSLFCELFGNLLARELGVETPAPALVTLSEELVEQLNPGLSTYNIRLVPGLAAGCEYMKSGLVSPIPLVNMSQEELAAATRLYASFGDDFFITFDLVSQNPDRRREKPNCGLLGGRLIAFDFEMAFSFIYALGKKPAAWRVSRLPMARNHLFHSHLNRHAQMVDWGPFVVDVSRLSRARIDELFDEVPVEWREHERAVRKHLTGVLRNHSKLQIELARSLL